MAAGRMHARVPWLRAASAHVADEGDQWWQRCRSTMTSEFVLPTASEQGTERTLGAELRSSAGKDAGLVFEYGRA